MFAYWRTFRAYRCVRRKQNKLAIELLEQAIQDLPDEPIAYWLRGRAWSEKGDLKQAMNDYTQALSLDPNRASGYRRRADIFRRLGRVQEAISDLSTAIELRPKVGAIFYDRAGLWWEFGEHQKALNDYSQAIKLDPQMDVARLARANGWINKGELDLALADLEAVVKRHPSWSEAYLSRGSLWLKKGDFERALADFDEAINRQTQNLALAYYSRAVVHSRKSDIDLAIDDYTNAIRYAPNDPQAFLGRCIVFFSKRAYESALADCRTAIKLAPKNLLFHEWFVRLLIDLGRHQEALEAFDVALALDATDTDFLEGLSWLLATSPIASVRDGNKALGIADKLVNELGASGHKMLVIRAAVYAECGRLDEAIVSQKAAIELSTIEEKLFDDEVLRIYEGGKPYRTISKAEGFIARQ